MHRNVLFAFFAAVFFSVFVNPAFADNRVALVIRNGADARVPHLPNPVHDAEDVAAALKRPTLRSWLRPISTRPEWMRR
jgi:hypothetical protein